MKLFNSKKTVASNQKAGGEHLPFGTFWQQMMQVALFIIFIGSATWLFMDWTLGLKDDVALNEQQSELQESMQLATEAETEEIILEENAEPTDPVLLSKYEALYNQNTDFIGWLRIEDTVIDYPVMQCLEDENYYLKYDFYKEENKNGCLILDNDSIVGIGIYEQEYKNGEKPSTNLIIHGHTMRSGQMFGNLKLYQDQEYGMAHNVIYFDSLYEERKYELIAVFYSQVYFSYEDVFKYYKFFQADTQEEFDDWYNNIKELSLYDTGVTAEFGDEFITLSCCAYHVEDGRFVVVGKRVYD